MQNFEIHITVSNEEILNVTGFKTIAIDLLKPDRSVLRTEFMTSISEKFKNYNECKKYTDWLALTLNDFNILRVKIESSFYPEYVEQSKYIESHFETENFDFPISRNKITLLGTDREYNHEKYNEFKEKYSNSIVELALFDNNINEDKDWFDLWKN